MHNFGLSRVRFGIMLGLMLSLMACSLTTTDENTWRPPDLVTKSNQKSPASLPSALANLPTHRPPGSKAITPTPNPPRILPTLRPNQETYVVQPNDSLGKIARQNGISLQAMVNANQIANPNLLEVGQVLAVPPPIPGPPGSAYKVIPDSELVFSPASGLTDLDAFIDGQQGYLRQYTEEIDGLSMSGAQIIDRVSREYSVNPRLLLALIEYQSGWVTKSAPSEASRDYPVSDQETWRKGLYRQLAWAANNLNRGYTLWDVNAIGSWVLADGSIVPVDATINNGTAGVQYLFSLLFDRPTWDKAVQKTGLQATYSKLFGDPFEFAIEPILPPDLQQPELQLPFESNQVWFFTGGPHGGWGDGSAWAALDFAPPDGGHGCSPSEAWITAAAPGIITLSANGMVVEDLDGDGLEQTGWNLLYLHVAEEGRVAEGTTVSAGDRIGHPSCEGGMSNGTHLHFARRYNGVWISADGKIPFNLEGWMSSGSGIEYDGYLTRQGVVVEAWDSRKTENQIQR
jgi:LasA protease